jgi:hypothetical protein
MSISVRFTLRSDRRRDMDYCAVQPQQKVYVLSVSGAVGETKPSSHHPFAKTRANRVECLGTMYKAEHLSNEPTNT